MRCRLTLAVLLLCCCVKADLASRLVLPRDSGVKLCGREFIRAVIFTCGGSRWRRSSGFDSPPWTLNGEEHSRIPAFETSEDPLTPLGSSSLEELLADYRRKRNSSQGVAGKCCSQGCTKNDIGRLC